MTSRTRLVPLLAGAMVVLALATSTSPGCCPAPAVGRSVVNADQSVVILWDAATKTEHFIRRASFRSAADDFGFLVPTPSKPELEEAGNDAFPYLDRLTAPAWHPRPQIPIPFTCGVSAPSTAALHVLVVEEKLVAGFQACVLEARSASALAGWLKAHDYAFSPEVEAWARPYVEAGWMITALKVAKDLEETEKARVVATSLRMSFKTERPLFPYREPECGKDARALGASHRLLRIYFIGEARYRGQLPGATAWTGNAVWSGKLRDADREQLLALLKLPAATGPAHWWLTEFEDDWPYQVAAGDLSFALDPKQATLKRAAATWGPSVWHIDFMVYALVLALFLPPLVRRLRRRDPDASTSQTRPLAAVA